MKKFFVGLATGLIIFGLVGLAYGTQINVNYSGGIDRLVYAEKIGGSSWNHTDVTESFFYDGLRISEGDHFLGNFSYDPNAPLTGISSDGKQAIYLDGVMDLYFSKTNFNLPTPTLPQSLFHAFSVVNDRYGSDSFHIFNSFFNSSWSITISLMLLDRDGTVYNDFSIPTIFNLDDFENLSFRMGFLRREDGDQLQVYGHLSDFSAAPIPEPTTMLLFGFGLLGIAGMSRKRKQ